MLYVTDVNVCRVSLNPIPFSSSHTVVIFHQMWLLASTVPLTSSWQSELNSVKKNKKSLTGCQTLLHYKHKTESQSAVKWLEKETTGQETHSALQEAAWCHLPSPSMFLAPARVFLRSLIPHGVVGGAASSWNHLEVLKTFSVMLTGSGMESAVSALVETFRECFQNIHNGSRRRRRKEKMRLRATTVIFGKDANSCKTYQL